MGYHLYLITSNFKFWLYNLFRDNNKFVPENLFEKRFNKTLKEKQNYQNSNEENSLSLKTEENNYSVKLSLTKPFHISGNSKTRPQSNYIETSARNIKNNTIENSHKKAYIIHRLAIPQMYRKNNIATKLMEYALNKAKEEGIEILKSDTEVSNDKMNRLFIKLGYIYKGQFVDEMFKRFCLGK